VIFWNTCSRFLDKIQLLTFTFAFNFSWTDTHTEKKTIFRHVHLYIKSRDSSVGMALDYGLDGCSYRVRSLAWAAKFSFRHRVHNISGTHPAFYPMGIMGFFTGSKAAVAWSLPLTSIYCRGQIMRRNIPPLPQYFFMAQSKEKA
jgi:hypothetical protein